MRLLTPRQRQVAAAIADGQTNAQIAANLGISVRTVDTHVADIKERLHLHTRTQVVAWVLTHPVLVPEQP